MIHTRACDVLGITHPVVLAGMGGCSSPELAAAVSEAGGLGILACTWTPPDDIRAQIADVRRRTSRPFGVNFVLDQVAPEKLDVAIEERVPVLSFFRGTDPSDIVARAQGAGLITTHQVTTMEEAQVSLAAGVDVVIAQGRVLAARDGDTVVSKMWDMLWGQEWQGMSARALRNDFTLRWAGREGELAASLGPARAEFAAAQAAKDHSRINMLAGEGSARIHSILPAAEIVRSMVAEAEAALRKATQLIR